MSRDVSLPFFAAVIPITQLYTDPQLAADPQKAVHCSKQDLLRISC
jgi:hypothetical protein